MVFRVHSLRSQLLLFITLGMIVTFVFMGVILHSAYRASLHSSIEEQLKLKVFEILAAAHLQQGEVIFPSILRNKQFNEENSGLYAFAYLEKKNELHPSLVWRSRSAGEWNWAFSHFLSSGQSEFSQKSIWNANKKIQENYFVFQYGVMWEWAKKNKKVYNLVVFHLADEYQNQLVSFETTLWFWFLIAVVLLILLELFFLKQLLKPLKKMEEEIVLIEKGEHQTLSGVYPMELKKIVDNLNWLIQHERNQREAYKNNIADLAHALKTPLAGLFLEVSVLEEDPLSARFQHQLNRIQDVISYHTKKSTLLTHNWSAKHEILPVIERICVSLDKVYHEKKIELSKEIDLSCHFHGDAGDLMECLGNILENAYKYGKTRVKVSVFQFLPENDSSAPKLVLIVEDDGNGIPAQLHDYVLERGARLDSFSQEGQGIGLSIVKQIVQSYAGEIKIGFSLWGGARFEICFPLLHK